MKNNNLDHKFKTPAIATDPISKGTFTIGCAYMLWTYDADVLDTNSRARGIITIDSINNNPLYKLAKESPLRLQGLIASVDFGVEKTFIKLEVIGRYNLLEIGGKEIIELDPITFLILDNIEYLENLEDYSNNNLL